MREFTLSKNFERFEFNLLEEKMGVKLPEELFLILENYGGASIEENIFEEKSSDTKWQLAVFSTFSQIYNYFDDINEELSAGNMDLKLLSFASEEGGWKFCISTEDSYPVYIFKTTDYAGKEAIQKIAPSFIEFINDLKCSDELS